MNRDREQDGTVIASMSLEEALSRLWGELKSAGARFRIVIEGRSKTVQPAIQEQICLIAREALVNALRHSEATSIEAEVRYLPRRLGVVVRDNGCGIDPKVARAERGQLWGLLGMHKRAESMGAQLRIWSGPGVGTEVEISVPGDIAVEGLVTNFERGASCRASSNGK